jgi:translation initiation factor 1
MSKKKIQGLGGLVYSTDPAFNNIKPEQEQQDELPAAKQPLRIVLDTRHRAGKAVTLIYGFSGKSSSLEELGKQLKSVCGTGGSVKDGEIIIQGDHREKVRQWLHKKGFTGARVI